MLRHSPSQVTTVTFLIFATDCISLRSINFSPPEPHSTLSQEPSHLLPWISLTAPLVSYKTAGITFSISSLSFGAASAMSTTDAVSKDATCTPSMANIAPCHSGESLTSVPPRKLASAKIDPSLKAGDPSRASFDAKFAQPTTQLLEPAPPQSQPGANKNIPVAIVGQDFAVGPMLSLNQTPQSLPTEAKLTSDKVEHRANSCLNNMLVQGLTQQNDVTPTDLTRHGATALAGHSPTTSHVDIQVEVSGIHRETLFNPGEESPRSDSEKIIAEDHHAVSNCNHENIPREVSSQFATNQTKSSPQVSLLDSESKQSDENMPSQKSSAWREFPLVVHGQSVFDSENSSAVETGPELPKGTATPSPSREISSTQGTSVERAKSGYSVSGISDGDASVKADETDRATSATAHEHDRSTHTGEDPNKSIHLSPRRQQSSDAKSSTERCFESGFVNSVAASKGVARSLNMKSTPSIRDSESATDSQKKQVYDTENKANVGLISKSDDNQCPHIAANLQDPSNEPSRHTAFGARSVNKQPVHADDSVRARQEISEAICLTAAVVPENDDLHLDRCKNYPSSAVTVDSGSSEDSNGCCVVHPTESLFSLSCRGEELGPLSTRTPAAETASLDDAAQTSILQSEVSSQESPVGAKKVDSIAFVRPSETTKIGSCKMDVNIGARKQTPAEVGQKREETSVSLDVLSNELLAYPNNLTAVCKADPLFEGSDQTPRADCDVEHLKPSNLNSERSRRRENDALDDLARTAKRRRHPGVARDRPPGARVFVGNLAAEFTSVPELSEIFKKYGPLIEEPVLRRSFGFIQYGRSEDALAAVHGEQGRIIGGISLDLTIADNRDVRKGAHVVNNTPYSRGTKEQVLAAASAHLSNNIQECSRRNHRSLKSQSLQSDLHTHETPGGVNFHESGPANANILSHDGARPVSQSGVFMRVISLSQQARAYAGRCEKIFRNLTRLPAEAINIIAASLGESLRQSLRERIPYVLVVATKDVESHTCSLRILEGTGYEKAGQGSGIIPIHDAMNICLQDRGIPRMAGPCSIEQDHTDGARAMRRNYEVTSFSSGVCDMNSLCPLNADPTEMVRPVHDGFTRNNDVYYRDGRTETGRPLWPYPSRNESDSLATRLGPFQGSAIADCGGGDMGPSQIPSLQFNTSRFVNGGAAHMSHPSAEDWSNSNSRTHGVHAGPPDLNPNWVYASRESGCALRANGGFRTDLHDWNISLGESGLSRHFPSSGLNNNNQGISLAVPSLADVTASTRFNAPTPPGPQHNLLSPYEMAPVHYNDMTRWSGMEPVAPSPTGALTSFEFTQPLHGYAPSAHVTGVYETYPTWNPRADKSRAMEPPCNGGERFRSSSICRTPSIAATSTDAALRQAAMPGSDFMIRGSYYSHAHADNEPGSTYRRSRNGRLEPKFTRNNKGHLRKNLTEMKRPISQRDQRTSLGVSDNELGSQVKSKVGPAQSSSEIPARSVYLDVQSNPLPGRGKAVGSHTVVTEKNHATVDLGKLNNLICTFKKQAQREMRTEAREYLDDSSQEKHNTEGYSHASLGGPDGLHKQSSRDVFRDNGQLALSHTRDSAGSVGFHASRPDAPSTSTAGIENLLANPALQQALLNIKRAN